MCIFKEDPDRSVNLTLNQCIYVLGFSITPGGVWILQTNSQYVITVDVYDKLNHTLYVAEV